MIMITIHTMIIVVKFTSDYKIAKFEYYIYFNIDDIISMYTYRLYIHKAYKRESKYHPKRVF